jgi:hypothetical protein
LNTYGVAGHVFVSAKLLASDRQILPITWTGTPAITLIVPPVTGELPITEIVTFAGAGVPKVRTIEEVAVPPAANVTEAGVNTELKPTNGPVDKVTVPVKPVRALTVIVDVRDAPQLCLVKELGLAVTV